MEERQIQAIAAALAEMVEYNNQLTPQFLPSFRENDHKTSHLRSAVIGKS